MRSKVKLAGAAISLIGIIVFCSCHGGRNAADRKGSDEYRMELAMEKQLYLDSMTAQTVSYMQLVGDTTLALFNAPMNDICLFDWETGTETGKISLHKEGPDAVRGIRGFYLHANDSVWLYNEWENDLYLVDADGNLKEKRCLKDLLYPEAKQPYSVSPFPQTNVLIRMVDNVLLLQGMNGIIADDVLPAATLLYDWDKNRVDVKNPYPSVYTSTSKINDEWNAFAYRQVPYTLGEGKELVSSFPASDSIVVYHKDTDSYDSYFAGYSEETRIKPHVPTSPTDGLRNYLEQYQYSTVLYDCYRKLYYRLVILPKTEYDLNDATTHQKDLAVIILDKDFRKVGESVLGHDRYMYVNSFVSAEGLCINVFSEDDDYLTFKVFKAVKNEV